MTIRSPVRGGIMAGRHTNLLIMLIIVVFLSACAETQYDVNARVYEAKFAYLPITEENGSLKVVNTSSGNLVTTLSIGRYPTAVAINDDGSRVFVTLRNSEAENGSVAVINAHTNVKLYDVDEVGYQPGGLIYHSPTGDIYVTQNFGVTRIYKGDDGNYFVDEDVIPTAFNSTSIDYVGNYIFTTGSVFDDVTNELIKSGVSMFDVTNPSVIYDLDLGASGASGMAIQNDNGQGIIYVTKRAKDLISVVEFSDSGLLEVDSIELRRGSAPSSIAYDPEYQRLFVANSAQERHTSASTEENAGGIAVVSINTGAIQYEVLGTAGSPDTYTEALHPTIVHYDTAQRRLYVSKNLWLANATGTYLSMIRNNIQELDVDSEFETTVNLGGPGPYMVGGFLGPVCDECPQGELNTVEQTGQLASIDLMSLMLLVLLRFFSSIGVRNFATKEFNRPRS